MSSSVVIGVAGGSGSGKTTLCDRIAADLGQHAQLISSDHYYHCLAHLPAGERATANFDHPDAIDFDLLAEHLKALGGGDAVHVPQYCFETHSRGAETSKLNARPLILVEGVLLFSSQLVREQLDIRIFVDADDEVRFRRRLERDVAKRGRTEASVREQWDRFVEPMHEQFVAPSRKHADLIIDSNRSNPLAYQVFLAGLRSLAS
ncbi:MAG: uridine kinase [Rubripirellula sp.]